MFFIPFWVFIVTTVILAGVATCFRKLRFIDIQVIIFVIAVSMSCDMLFCKQLSLYNYVNAEYKGWYSFWANFIACPAFGLIFAKFIPARRERTVFYIIIWAVFFTLYETYILKPYGILYVHGWHTIPWSLIGYVLALSLEYIYFNLLEKREGNV